MSAPNNQPKFTSFITMIAGVLLLFVIVTQVGNYKIHFAEPEKDTAQQNELLAQREKALVTIGALNKNDLAAHKNKSEKTAPANPRNTSAIITETPTLAQHPEKTATNKVAEKTQPPTNTAIANAQPKYYKVRGGDTLFGIAQKIYGNGAEWQKITKANKLSANAGIKIGQRLIIPAPTTPNENYTAWLKKEANRN